MDHTLFSVNHTSGTSFEATTLKMKLQERHFAASLPLHALSYFTVSAESGRFVNLKSGSLFAYSLDHEVQDLLLIAARQAFICQLCIDATLQKNVSEFMFHWNCFERI